MENNYFFLVAVIVAIAVFGLYFGMQQATGNVTASFDGETLGSFQVQIVDPNTLQLLPVTYSIYYGTALIYSGALDVGAVGGMFPPGIYSLEIQPQPSLKYKLIKFNSFSVVADEVKDFGTVKATKKKIYLKAIIKDSVTNALLPVAAVTLTDVATGKKLKMTTSSLGIINFPSVGGSLIDADKQYVLGVDKVGYNSQAGIPAVFDQAKATTTATTTIYPQDVLLVKSNKTTVNVTITDALGNPMAGELVKARYICEIKTYYWGFYLNYCNVADIYSGTTDAQGKASFAIEYSIPDKDQNVLVNAFIPSDNNGTLINKSVSVGKTVNLNFTKFTGTSTVNVTAKTKDGQDINYAVIDVKWKSKLNVYGTSINYDFNTVPVICKFGSYYINPPSTSCAIQVPVPNNGSQKSTLIFGDLGRIDTKSYYYNKSIGEYVAKTLNLVNGQTYDITWQMTK